MTADAAPFTPEALPQLAFAFMLLFARIAAACMLLPGIGEDQLPATIRLGFAAALTVLLLPGLAPAMPALPAEPLRLFALVGAEIATGLMFGWLVRVMLLALPVAGQFIAGVGGLSNVIQPDPETGPQTAALARALALAAPVVVLASGLFGVPLRALADSYAVIPAGALLPPVDSAAQALAAVGDAFALSLQLAAPFVLAATLWQFALGITSRLVPQMQVYFAAMPGQIGGGLLLFALLVRALLAVWQGWLADSFATLPGH